MGKLVRIKAANTDAIWNAWKRKMSTDKKWKALYTPKGAQFSIDNVSAAQFVSSVEKSAVFFYFLDKSVKKDSKKGEKVSEDPKRVQKVTFYEFSNKSVEKSSWKGENEVPSYKTLKPIPCPKCKGKGGIACKKCNNGSTDCNKCKNGKISCKNCGGTGTEVLEISVINADSGKSRKETIQQKCSLCFGQKELLCSNCNGTGKILCSRCGGTGLETCSDCGNTGRHYQYEVIPVPFKELESKQGFIISCAPKLTDKIDDIISNDLEKELQTVEFIRISEPNKELDPKVIPPLVGVDKNDTFYGMIQKKTKGVAKHIKKSEENEDEKIKLPIALIPMQVLECTTNKKRTYSVFALGSENKFKLYSDY